MSLEVKAVQQTLGPYLTETVVRVSFRSRLQTGKAAWHKPTGLRQTRSQLFNPAYCSVTHVAP